MDTHKRAIAALRRPTYVYLCSFGSAQAAKNFTRLSDSFPAIPSQLLRTLGVDWRLDPDISYGCLILPLRSAKSVRQLLTILLKRWKGRWASKLRAKTYAQSTKISSRRHSCVVFVHSDTRFKHRGAFYRLIAVSRSLQLFDLDDLATGSMCFSSG